MKSEINFAVAILIAVIFHVAFETSCAGSDFLVSNADDIETAMETAQPGDTLIMTDGTLDRPGDPTSPASAPRATRSPSGPQTPGGVVLTRRVPVTADLRRPPGRQTGCTSKTARSKTPTTSCSFAGRWVRRPTARFTNSVIESYNGRRPHRQVPLRLAVWSIQSSRSQPFLGPTKYWPPSRRVAR